MRSNKVKPLCLAAFARTLLTAGCDTCSSSDAALTLPVSMTSTTQPLRANRHEYLSERTGTVRPLWEEPVSGGLPCRYPWKDMERQLDLFADAAGSPNDGIILEYINPLTGGSALPTLRCCAQRLKPGFSGQRHRKTASTVFYVIEGEGTLKAGDTELHWKARDVFVVPTWTWYELINASGSASATLFSVSDAPLLEAAQLYREEPESTLRRSVVARAAQPPKAGTQDTTAGSSGIKTQGGRSRDE